jgi:hypothetical protein
MRMPSNRVKPRGYPDRRGMGAQSDFVSETFVPSEEHRREQLRMASVLLSAGMSPERVAASLSLPIALLDQTPGAASTEDPS